MDGLSSVDVLAEVFIAVCFVEFHFLFLCSFLYIILYNFLMLKISFFLSRRFVLLLFGFVVGVSG